ncbi:hypothetical protein B5M47_02585 [candidate division CPR3 bacterium 4484_211]|uniref:DNA polymerase III subunit delta n=1 Tax=candidate division CPR3 bacterium 4484_211 TaxID=1968527 RepID=A0A1W9NXP1_UNCC3|nr:MAG: hypothetical protein B5M47_02585 [candidate division CPR3 bacterium 4484_211]
MSRSYLLISRHTNILASPSPDLKIIAPSISGSIGIRQAQELIQWAYLKPYRQRSKCALVVRADQATTEAQNSLLKLLEEPPENTNLILIARRRTVLLPTIISRCQTVRWEKLSLEQQTNLLKTLHLPIPFFPSDKLSKELPPDKAEFLKILSEPKLVSAFRWIAAITSSKTRQEIIELLNQALVQLHHQKPLGQNLILLLDKIEKTKQLILKNANEKLALENLVLEIYARNSTQES